MVIRLGIIGAQGKMGSRIINCAKEDPSLIISWEATSQKKPPLNLKTDAIIDFSTLQAFKENLTYALDTKTPLVIGTTGLQGQDREALNQASLEIPVLWAANFSLGMTALIHAAELLTSFLQKNFTLNISETHHQHKKDAPSGSALTLAEAIEKTGGARPDIQSIRSGEIIGEHSVFFSGKHEKITLTHEAVSRDAFAFGALEAAKFLAKSPPWTISDKRPI